MTKLEMACVIIGFIMFIGCSPASDDKEDKSSTPIDTSTLIKISRHIMIRMVVTRIVCGLMILLPLYFRYWR